MFKYEAVKRFLLEEMKQLDAGRKMPSVRSLASRLQVSVATVLRALQEMEQQKLIKRFQGSGTVALSPDGADARLFETGRDVRPVLVASVDFPNEFVLTTEHAIEHTLKDYGFTAMNFRFQQGMHVRDIVDFIDGCSVRFRGLVIAGVIGKISTEEWQSLRNLPFRVALVDCMDKGAEPLPSNCAGFDNDPAQASEIVVDYLVRRGHTRLGFLRSEPGHDFAVCQLRQFKKSALEHGLEFDSRFVFSKPVHAFDDSLEVARDIMEHSTKRLRELGITAIFGSSSYGIVAIVNTLRNAGFRVPEDVSLVGQGNFTLAKYLSPSLTLVQADQVKKIDMVVKWLNGERLPSRNMLFSLELQEGESVVDR